MKHFTRTTSNYSFNIHVNNNVKYIRNPIDLSFPRICTQISSKLLYRSIVQPLIFSSLIKIWTPTESTLWCPETSPNHYTLHLDLQISRFDLLLFKSPVPALRQTRGRQVFRNFPWNFTRLCSYDDPGRRWMNYVCRGRRCSRADRLASSTDSSLDIRVLCDWLLFFFTIFALSHCLVNTLSAARGLARHSTTIDTSFAIT